MHHLCEDAIKAERYREGTTISGDEELISLLLAKDIDLNKKENIESRTPLHSALVARNERLACV